MSSSVVDPPASVPIRSRTFAALVDNSDYRKFFIGQGISLVGTWLQDAAVSWIVFEMTRSESTLGLVSAAGTLPGLLVGLYAGAVADRSRPKTMILAMQIGQMICAFLLAFLVASGAVRVWQMALVLAITRVLVTFEMPCRQVFLYDLVGRSALTNAIALNSGLFNASKVVGPALAGIFLARLGGTACFAVNGASYLAAITALLLIRRPHRPLPPHPEHEGILGGLGYLRKDRRITLLLLFMMFFCVIGLGYAALVPAYARRVVVTGEYGYSLLLAASGLGATVGALAVASSGGLKRRERLIFGGMAFFGLSLALAGGLPPVLLRVAPRPVGLAVAALGMFGAGLGAIVFFTATQTAIQTAVPDRLRGRIMGLWMIAFSGSVPLGSLWAGVAAGWVGVGPVMVVSAILCIAAAWLGMASGILTEKQPLS